MGGGKSFCSFLLAAFLFVSFWFLLYTSNVLLGTSWSFLINVLLSTDKKKKKKI